MCAAVKSPYEGLEPRAFWRLGVAESESYPPDDLFRPKFQITKTDRIMTAGSCFAQHVGRALRANNFCVLDLEPPPIVADHKTKVSFLNTFGYLLYSARYGNIYSIRQFLQLAQEAYGEFEPADAVWEKDGSYFDGLRPSVEPEGLPSVDLITEARKAHLYAVREAFAQADLIVFTLGLTETWEHIETGTVYPTAPGTIAGSMDASVSRFRNLRHSEICADFEALRSLLIRKNGPIRFLLTVSPVQLTATASNQHILEAVTYSKSVLRAVCGELYEDFDDVDYFPSYEIVMSPTSAGQFFAPNKRTVLTKGVSRIMKCFIAAQTGETPTKKRRENSKVMQLPESDDGDDLICEELLLEAFNK
jgi:hypothetical protein